MSSIAGQTPESARRWSPSRDAAGQLASSPVQELNDLTAGLNWYLNPHTRFQLNYVHAMLKTSGVGDSNADIVAMRAQIDF